MRAARRGGPSGRALTRRGWALFGSLGVIWGLPYLLVKVAVRDMSPAFLVFARTSSAALLLLPVALARRELAAVLRRWRPLALYTLAEIGLPWLLLASAERRLSSSLAGLLVGAVPIVGAVLGRTTGARERLGATRITGLVLGLTGVGALVGFDVHASDALSVGELGVVVVGYAFGPWLFDRYLADLPNVGVVTGSLALCALAYLPAAFLAAPDRLPGAQALGAIAALVVVCTWAGFIAFFALIGEIGPARATVITYVNPAVAVLVGVAFLDEHFGLGTGLGFALILAGSFLSTRARPEGAPKPAHASPADRRLPAVGEP